MDKVKIQTNNIGFHFLHTFCFSNIIKGTINVGKKSLIDVAEFAVEHISCNLTKK